MLFSGSIALFHRWYSLSEGLGTAPQNCGICSSLGPDPASQTHLERPTRGALSGLSSVSTPAIRTHSLQLTYHPSMPAIGTWGCPHTLRRRHTPGCQGPILHTANASSGFGGGGGGRQKRPRVSCFLFRTKGIVERRNAGRFSSVVRSTA